MNKLRAREAALNAAWAAIKQSIDAGVVRVLADNQSDAEKIEIELDKIEAAMYERWQKVVDRLQSVK